MGDMGKFRTLAHHLQALLTLLYNIQAAGGFYVPILHTHPVAEMTYIVENSQSDKLIVHKTLEDKGRQLAEQTGYVEFTARYTFR